MPDAARAASYYAKNPGPERAMLLEDNDSALAERIRLIDSAKERILLSTFDMRKGESLLDVEAALLAAADRGVDIKILVDGFSGMMHMEGRSVFYALSSYPGIEVRLYNKPDFLRPWTFNGRMHDKYLVADDRAYILGGRNTFDYFLGDYIQTGKSYDRDVLIYCTAEAETDRNPEKATSLDQIEAYFDGLWNHSASRPFHKAASWQNKEQVREQVVLLRERYRQMTTLHPDWFTADAALKDYYLSHTHPTNKVTLISGETTILAKRPVVWEELKNLMQHAEKSVIFQTPYVVLNEYMLQDLKELAAAEHDFCLLLNDVKSGDNLVASSDYLRRRPEILSTGAKILEYRGAFSSHGKSVLIDGRLSLIGSYNFDMRSTYLDTELMLAVDSPDLAADLQKAMDVFLSQSVPARDAPRREITAGASRAQKTLWHLIGALLEPFRYVI